MSSSLSQSDHTEALRELLLQSQNPLWTNVILNWIPRFDGWYARDNRDDPDGERVYSDPAAAIAYQALRRDPIRKGFQRTLQFVARLPFNRWHAIDVTTLAKWNPLEQTFREFEASHINGRICAFVAPEVPALRLRHTLNYLQTMYDLEQIKRAAFDGTSIND